jgi:hypothetical protein
LSSTTLGNSWNTRVWSGTKSFNYETWKTG